MAVKPTLPKGVRDLLPQSMQQREFILEHIKSVFKKYGFVQIETPAMENLNTLTGKYGEEGDRLIFKILNSGDFISKSDKDAFADGDVTKLTSSISEKALRYDLTVPFARFVVQNQNEITFPFKRFQIQPVWRADRPQKGRFREFYQCDADAVGSDSLLLEVEFISIYREVFEKLNIPVTVKMNNRKVLAGLAEVFEVKDKLTDFTVALDKLDKIGVEGVQKEMSAKGLSDKAIQGVAQMLNLGADLETQLQSLEVLLANSEIGKQGLEEVKYTIRAAQNLAVADVLELDCTLARGLDYYTGAIFEVKANGVEMGSIGGGGRYDDLTGIFGMKNLSGIGISFGLDRIQLVMEELQLFPDMVAGQTKLLFINFGDEEALYSLGLAQELRKLGIYCEVYPDSAKMKKQLDFANKKNIPFVVMIGTNEIKEGKFTLKNMEAGTQQSLSRIELLEFFNPENQHANGLH